jgi:hypothetical protein
LKLGDFGIYLSFCRRLGSNFTHDTSSREFDGSQILR